MTEFEELMQRVVCGELSPMDPEVRSMRERDLEFDRELEGLLELQRSLDGASGEMNAELLGAQAGSERSRIDPQLDRFRRSQGDLAHAGSTPKSRPVGRLVLAAAGLALAISGAWWMTSGRGEQPQESGVLGGARTVEGALPQGPGSDFGHFFAPVGTEPIQIEFEVLAATGGQPIASSGRLQSPRWDPPREVHSNWPDEIRWRWTAWRLTGDLDRLRSSPGELSASR